MRELKAALEENCTIDPTAWLSERGGIDGCEFLILTIKDGLKKLNHVSDGSAREGQRFYIGMQDEYERYLNLRQPYAGPMVRVEMPSKIEMAMTEGEKEFDIAANAMEMLASDNAGRKFEIVGAISGCVTRVVDARISGEFEYLRSITASNFPWEPEGGYTMLASKPEHARCWHLL
ncbi:hypothetical protein [Bradyrhizobium australiense]|uniref:Uncharacterized protein n=1 Tax=Bradyrhizobium australiense TaxID=2721161 RepID=A0A7Y4LXZ1_9BRAD|nr:hypothetical protein [Bradyrhizobium australiense]NOJ42210.1 hypothetical protein [Bradyrhizobium australiense]